MIADAKFENRVRQVLPVAKTHVYPSILFQITSEDGFSTPAQSLDKRPVTYNIIFKCAIIFFYTSTHANHHFPSINYILQWAQLQTKDAEKKQSGGAAAETETGAEVEGDEGESDEDDSGGEGGGNDSGGEDKSDKEGEDGQDSAAEQTR